MLHHDDIEEAFKEISHSARAVGLALLFVIAVVEVLVYLAGYLHGMAK
jgi:hypothetical protein